MVQLQFPYVVSNEIFSGLELNHLVTDMEESPPLLLATVSSASYCSYKS